MFPSFSKQRRLLCSVVYNQASQLGEDLLALGTALLLSDQRRLQQCVELHEPLAHRPSAAVTSRSPRARARARRAGRATTPGSGAGPGRTLC